MYITVQNEKIFYKKAGAGTRSFVLLHNAGGSHQLFSHQMKTLGRLGTVYAFDLPGYGQSQASQERYTTKETAALVAEAIKKLQLSQVYLVGLNNGANISIEISLNKDIPITQLVLIDPILFMSKDFITEIEDFITHLEAPDVDVFIDGLIDAFFIKTSDANKRIANKAFKQCSKKVAAAALKDLILWSQEAKSKLLALFVPTLVVLTNEHHCPYQPLKGLNPLIDLAKVTGSKCWATLEVPEQVNAIIKRVVELQDKPMG